MMWRRFETLVVCVFIVVTFVEFIPFVANIRLFGQNMLNPKLWSFIVVGVMLLGGRKSFFTPTMLVFYIYFVLYLALEIFGHYDLQGIRPGRYNYFTYMHIALGVTLVIRERFTTQSRISDLRLITKVALWSLFVTSVLSIYVTFRFPGAVRGSDVAFQLEDVSIYRNYGLGSYPFFSTIPFLIPGVIYQIKNSIAQLTNTRALIWMTFVIVLLICSYKAAIVAPLLLAIAVAFISVLGRRRFKANLAIIVLVIVILALIPKTFYSKFFIDLSYSIPNREVASKIRDIGISFEGDFELLQSEEGANTSIESRASRILINLNQFVTSPIVGTGKAGNEHLFWLNILAQFGLLGILPLLWILFHHIKVDVNKYDDEFKFYYLVTMLAFFTMGFMKAIGGVQMFMTPLFIVPSMFYLKAHTAKQGVRVDQSSRQQYNNPNARVITESE